MPRELGDGRSRYGRRGLREQLGDLLAWPLSNHVATGVLLVVVVGALLLVLVRGRPANVHDLVVGDCLFVHTTAAQDDDRPIGRAEAVEDVVLAGGARQAGCTASHGHEVAAIVTPAPILRTLAPDEMPLALDEAVIRAMTAPLCDQAFEAYVGRPLGQSRYVTFPVVPDVFGAAAWIDDGRRTVCLVARADGQWMHYPARGSGE